MLDKPGHSRALQAQVGTCDFTPRTRREMIDTTRWLQCDGWKGSSGGRDGGKHPLLAKKQQMACHRAWHLRSTQYYMLHSGTS